MTVKLAHLKFHGIPWNCSCHRNWRTPSSMEFHGTAGVSAIDAPQVPWNSMELLVSAKLAHSKFHGIPWNYSCQRNWHTPSSMEFHGTAGVIKIGALQVLWNSMESHGTARVIEIDALLVPWNSMELLVSSKLAHSKFHGIPWNTMELLMSAKLAHSKIHGIPWNSTELLVSAKLAHLKFHGIPWNSMELLVSSKLAHS